MTYIYTCYAQCEHGGLCTLPEDHEGNHEAWGLTKLTCTWPRKEKT